MSRGGTLCGTPYAHPLRRAIHGFTDCPSGIRLLSLIIEPKNRSKVVSCARAKSRGSPSVIAKLQTVAHLRKGKPAGTTDNLFMMLVGGFSFQARISTPIFSGKLIGQSACSILVYYRNGIGFDISFDPKHTSPDLRAFQAKSNKRLEGFRSRRIGTLPKRARDYLFGSTFRRFSTMRPSKPNCRPPANK
jgi:hypothetical protein